MKISDSIRDAAGLGEFIRTVRRLKGQRLADVAQNADLSINTISRVEKGLMVTFETFTTICRALGIRISLETEPFRVPRGEEEQ